MTVDDLNAPLGQQPPKRRSRLPATVPWVIAGLLVVFFGVFAVWAVMGDNPFGGEPMVVVPADIHAGPAKGADAQKAASAGSGTVDRYDGPPGVKVEAAPSPSNTKTVTIIDGKTGQRQEIAVPAPATDAAAASAAATPAERKFTEMTPQGPIPRIAADGTRPAEAFARPVKQLAGKPDAPRIAIVVTGLGISASATADAIGKLPGAVTLGFMPYASNAAALVARARDAGHEILLQIPMEPFDYPDNDPGPQTLLTSLAPQQNIERLYWLLSRFQGYVGITNAMGARFTASEQSFTPVLQEAAKRGLIFVDDGSSPRSLAGRIAGADNLPFAKADVVLDSVPSPGEIDRALTRLETAARERSVAVGVASALPVAIDHIAAWAKAAESRGLLLVPITAVAVKAKAS